MADLCIVQAVQGILHPQQESAERQLMEEEGELGEEALMETALITSVTFSPAAVAARLKGRLAQSGNSAPGRALGPASLCSIAGQASHSSCFCYRRCRQSCISAHMVFAL